MDTANLSTGDVLEATGIDGRKFQKWVGERRLIQPVAGGERQGRFRRWTVMQAVGIAVAWIVWTGDRGCCERFVRELVEAFENMDEGELLGEFEVGRTHLVMIHKGRLVLGGAQYLDWVDVQGTYEKVTGKIKEISKRYKDKFIGGRGTGLAQAAVR